jgi:hypothetical protein
MEFLHTLPDSIAADAPNNAEIFVVKDYQVDDISTLIRCRVVTVVRGRCPYPGCLSRRDKKMLYILKMAIEGGCKCNTMARHLEIVKTSFGQRQSRTHRFL